MGDYRIAELATGYVVVIGEGSSERHQLGLSKEELAKLSAGRSILKGGVLIRSEGSQLEFRVVRPGVRPERRRLGYVPFDAFVA